MKSKKARCGGGFFTSSVNTLGQVEPSWMDRAKNMFGRFKSNQLSSSMMGGRRLRKHGRKTSKKGGRRVRHTRKYRKH